LQFWEVLNARHEVNLCIVLLKRVKCISAGNTRNICI